MPDITIFIRARNEAALITECLTQVFAQRISQSFEVIILDCESDDGTVDCARAFPVQVYSLPPEFFSYSRALNFGVAVMQGELFVPLSAHAIPADEHWLEQLVAPVLENERSVASYSRQIPFPQACPSEIAALEESFPGMDKSFCLDRLGQAALRGASLYQHIWFSNVSACIRRETVRQFPFREIQFSEDRLFAIECVKAGYTITYASQSKVYHLHPPSLRENKVIAQKAMVAKNHIIQFFDGPSPSIASRMVALKLMFESIGKLLVFPFWLALSVLSCLLTSQQRYNRELTFRFATLGTVLGKLSAAVNLLKAPVEELNVADASPLLEAARKLE